MTNKQHKHWAIILGGSSGLGLATANKLATHGYNLIILHRDRRADMPRISEAFEQLKAKGASLKNFNVDATHPEKREEVLAQLSALLPSKEKIRVLVHSIAKGNLKPMANAESDGLSSQDFQTTFNAMALSLYDWTRDLLRLQLFAEDCRVISFTSQGSSRALPNYAAVASAKAALEAITRSMALEFAKFGLKANCIQAGITDTSALKQIPGSEAIMERALKQNPNGRLTLPEDIANAAYLLCSEEASWITGTVIPVDGGESLS